MQLIDLLKEMKAREASDLYLTAGAAPAMRIYGQIKPHGELLMSAEQVKALAYSVMNDEQQKAFEALQEMNMAISEPDVGRFRMNIFVQKGQVGMVVRNIHTVIPDLKTLGLPDTLSDLIMSQRGLILFVGATGAGKSTSLAALINHRNQRQTGHIICIEDPIEFIHENKKSIVNQREVGIDTHSYAEALKNTLRQAPDVILIGEVRTRETMEHAITFAETGHLCLSTLHANNANQALDRIINFFPEEKRQQLLLDLSFNLRAVISQRLVPTLDGKRAAAVEVLLGTPLISDYIKRGELDAIKEVMEKSENLGMQTFDMALEQLFRAGKISFEEALKHADSANNLRVKIELSQKEGHDKPESDQAPQKKKPLSKDDDSFNLVDD